MFIDETAIYPIMPSRRALVAPEHRPLIIVEKPSAYTERYDFIGAISSLRINGIYLICNRSRSHNKADMIEALKISKWQSLVDILYMPTSAAK